VDYEVVDVLKDGSDKQIDPTKKYIFVMSVELYKQADSSRALLQDIKGGANRANLFICDEAHLKQTTEKAIKEMEDGTAVPKSAEQEDKEEEYGLGKLDEEISGDVPVIYMTGTYIKPMTVFKIPEEHIALWDYEDIQQGKNIIDNQEYFKQNFPEIYEEALAKCFAYGETYESIQNMYRRFPNLYLLSTQFTDSAKWAFLEQSKGGEIVGFPTITHLFQVKKEFDVTAIDPSLWYTGFTNQMGMGRLINYLSPRNEIEGVDPIPSVMSRIDRISQRIGDRLAFFTKDFVVHSQLWFLPTMQGHPLIKRMCALAGTIFRSAWYRKNFIVLGVASSVVWTNIPGAKERRINVNGGSFAWACPTGEMTLKACILREEAEARKQGKGLVILALDMLHLGISLSCVDIVVLLDAGEKVDQRIQKMYRALTESTNKKGGFIVDMNYFRTVTAIMNYQITTSESREKKKIYADSPGFGKAFNSVIETYSIDDDLDIYGTKEEGGGRIVSETIPELVNRFKKAPLARGDGITLKSAGNALNKNIENVLKDEYGPGLHDILGQFTDDPEKKPLREHGSDVEAAEEEKVQDEKERRKRDLAEVLRKGAGVDPEAKRKAFIDMIKTTLKLGVFGTSYKTVEELLNGIREDKDSIRDILYDTLVKRHAIKDDSDKEKVFHVIIKELELIENKKVGSYSGMKESYNARDSRSQGFVEVLKYIEDNLTPKDIERHKYGEVFTPLTLVDEMLSKLPQSGEANVWNKKEYKWLDPANGIGNFPIKAFMGQAEGEYKYPGLFEGLRKEIPDDQKRCKWIIENMLYMIDINGKNNMVSRKLFEKICPDAKANIEQIDKKNGFLSDKPLTFNGKELKEFDIVMGNPPFNRGAVSVAMVTNKTKNARKKLGIEDDKAESGYWFKFVEKALAKGILKSNGFLLFIHPITWFKPDMAGAHDLMLSRQLLNIRIYFKAQAKQLFKGKGEISVAYYLLENKNQYTKTNIINMKGGKEVINKLTPKSILILEGNTIYNKVVLKSKLFGNGEGLLHKTIKECNDVGQYKLITILEDSGEIKYIKSSVAHPDQHTPKIIVGGVPKPIVLFDKDGEYGLFARGQRHYFVGEELDKINNYFKTKLSTYILRNVKFEQGFIKPSYYPDVRLIPKAELKDNGGKVTGEINDETLANYFGFTEEEREEISKMPVPIHPKADKIIKITCAQLKGEKTEEEPEAKGGSRKPHRVTRKIRR
jgi:hypothetical protein